jgi:trans-aconitate methyltransferase
MRNLLILALAVCLPSAAWAGELPCTLTKADYLTLANTESKATPDSVKKLSPDDQEDLCASRAYTNVVQKKKGEIDIKDVTYYDPRFVTKAEADAIEIAATKALARVSRPFFEQVFEQCRKDPSACPPKKP